MTDAAEILKMTGTGESPSAQVIESILAQAVRAPSGDNTQPFSFSWSRGELAIIFRPERAEHPFEAGFIPSGLALGCLQEALQIAARAHGWVPRFQFEKLAEGGHSIESTLHVAPLGSRQSRS